MTRRTTLLSGLLCLAGAVIPGSGSRAQSATALVLAFSEGSGASTSDSSGNGNDGALVNGAVFTASGRYGSGVAFDGIDDRIDVPTSPSMNISTALTAEAWVYPTSNPPYGTIVRQPAATGDVYQVQVRGDRTLFARVNTTGGSGSVYGSAVMPIGEWTHVAATWDGTVLRTYVNGLFDGSVPLSGTAVPASGPLVIGGGPGTMFTGRIDEARLCRQALSAADLGLDMTAAIDGSAPPGVASQVPAAGTTGIAQAAGISATFTKPMAGGGITTGYFLLHENGSNHAVPASVTYDPSTRTATLTPESPMAQLTTYRVTILGGTSGVQDALGGTMPADVVWTFRTAPAVLVPQLAYPFSEAAGSVTADVSGNERTAILVNGTSWTPEGRYGPALSFDGTNDRVEVAASPPLNASSAFTLEAWVFPTGPLPYGGIITRPIAGGGGTYWLQICCESRLVTSATTAAWVSAYGTTTIPGGQWTHVAATWDGSTLRTYVNGIQDGAMSLTGTLASSSEPLRIGGGPGIQFTGRVDEVRLYHRALSAGELVSDMFTAIDEAAAPAVAAHTPGANVTGVAAAAPVTVTFSKAMSDATVTSASVVLRREDDQVPVDAALAYEASTRTATLSPSAPLQPLTTYRATVVGGSTGVRDTAGMSMPSDTTWTFRTAPGLAFPQLAYAFSEGSGLTTADRSGNDRTATLINGTGWTADGRFGPGLLFDGTNDRVEAAASPPLDVTTAFTVEAWVYPTAATPYGTIIGRPLAGGGAAYLLHVCCGARPFGWGTTAAGPVATYGTTTIPPHQWSHVAATWDGASLRTYVNGIQDGTMPLGGTLVRSAEPLRLGGGPGTQFTGRIDEVRLYHRALSGAELATDMSRPIHDAEPPAVTHTSPLAGATDVEASANVLVAFSESMAPESLSGGSLQLRDPVGALVPGVVAYDAATRTATLDPSSALARGVMYSVLVRGGSTGVRDLAGLPLAADLTWSFTTYAAPPSITAAISPAPNAAGWNNSAATVTFTCSPGDAPLEFCSPPRNVFGEGPAVVVGEARDQAGRRSTITVTLMIDRSAPVVRVHTPEAGEILPLSATVAHVRGSATDALSGVETVTCGGVAASILGTTFSCAVPVGPGSNVVAIDARDSAGFSATRSVAVVVGEPPAPAAIEISPATMTMIAGDTRRLAVTDDRGRAVLQGTWSTAQPLVATVAADNGIASVQALASGEATLTVTYGELTATAAVTVLPSDSTTENGLPAGTTLWSLTGTTVPPRGQVLRAVPVDGGVTEHPDLFFVDEGTQWVGSQLARVGGRPTQIRATTLDGRLLWRRSVTDRIATHFAADNQGGMVIVYPAQTDTGGMYAPGTIQRLDGATGRVTWEHTVDGSFSEVAMHPDGRIFATVYPRVGPFRSLVAVAPDGSWSGWPLPSGQFFDGVSFPTPTGPIVGEDGTVVVVSGRANTSGLGFTPFVEVIELQPGAGNLTVSGVNISAVPFVAKPDFGAYRLMPDGEGGLLVGHTRLPQVFRVARAQGVYVLQPAASLTPLGPGESSLRVEYVLGEDAAYAMVLGVTSGTFSAPAQFWARAVAFDPATLAVSSSAPLGEPRAQDTQLQLQFAVAGGGVYVSGPTEAYTVNATVSTGDFGGGGHAVQVLPGRWTGWQPSGPSHLRGADAIIGTTAWAYRRGNSQSGQAPRRPTLVHFVEPDLLRIAPPYTSSEYTIDVREQVDTGGLNAGVVFFIQQRATVGNFYTEWSKTGDAVAFIGHSVVVPSVGSVGLRFVDGSIVKPPFQGPDPTTTHWASRLDASSKIVFIASCQLGDEFMSLWNIDESTSGRAMIVPVDDSQNTNLFLGAWAWFFIAKSLGEGKTVAASVADGNAWLANTPLRFQVIGDDNVKIR